MCCYMNSIELWLYSVIPFPVTGLGTQVTTEWILWSNRLGDKQGDRPGDRQGDRQGNRQGDRQGDRQGGRETSVAMGWEMDRTGSRNAWQTETDTDRQADRQTDRQLDREAGWLSFKQKCPYLGQHLSLSIKRTMQAFLNSRELLRAK